MDIYTLMKDWFPGIAFFLISGGYVTQILRMFRGMDATGVSFQAYLVTFIAACVMTFNAESDAVLMLGATEALLCLMTMIPILLFNQGRTERITPSFWIALICGFFMIHGVLQGIKTYKTTEYSRVSISSYLLWIILDLMIIYLAANLMIQIALSISIVIYCFIIVNTGMKNGQYEEKSSELKPGERFLELSNGDIKIISGGGFWRAVTRSKGYR